MEGLVEAGEQLRGMSPAFPEVLGYSNSCPSVPAGSPITPNYIDNSTSSIAPWCTCNASGNRQEECESFLHLFTNNACLRKCCPLWGCSARRTGMPWSPCVTNKGALKSLGHPSGGCRERLGKERFPLP